MPLNILVCVLIETITYSPKSGELFEESRLFSPPLVGTDKDSTSESCRPPASLPPFLFIFFSANLVYYFSLRNKNGALRGTQGVGNSSNRINQVILPSPSGTGFGFIPSGSCPSSWQCLVKGDRGMRVIPNLCCSQATPLFSKHFRCITVHEALALQLLCGGGEVSKNRP